MKGEKKKLVYISSVITLSLQCPISAENLVSYIQSCPKGERVLA